MAKGDGSLLIKHISGQIGKQFVIKQYADKTVITAYPVRNKRKPTELQKIYGKRFTEAIKYAQGIIRNRELKKQYQLKLGPSKRVYNYAISEYLKEAKRKDRSNQQ